MTSNGKRRYRAQGVEEASSKTDMNDASTAMMTLFSNLKSGSGDTPTRQQMNFNRCTVDQLRTTL